MMCRQHPLDVISLDNVFVFVLPRPRQLRPHSLTEVTSLHQCHTSFLRKPNSESNLVYIWQMADPEFLVGSLIFMKSKGKHFWPCNYLVFLQSYNWIQFAGHYTSKIRLFGFHNCAKIVYLLSTQTPLIRDNVWNEGQIWTTANCKINSQYSQHMFCIGWNYIFSN